jgi:hypothetical protein
MKRLLVLGMLLLFVGSAHAAQMIAGFTPIFAKQLTENSYLPESFTDRATLYEVEVGVFSSGVSLRGYHLLKKPFTNVSSIYNEKDKKYIPVSFESYFYASRLELGLPFFYMGGSVIEPFFVNSYNKRLPNNRR